MAKWIKLDECSNPWCVAAGTWFVEDLSPDYVVDDGTPIFEGEPVAALREVGPESYGRLFNLNLAISTASNVLYAKMLAKLPIYVPLSQLAWPWGDFIRAGAAGGLDGVLDDVGGAGLDVGLPVMSMEDFRHLRDLDSAAKGVVISMRNRISAKEAERALMDVVYAVNPNAVILLETSIDALRRHHKEVEAIREAIDGVLLSSIPTASRLAVAPQRQVNIYRCRSCYLDYESGTAMRKCPKCQGRLVPLLRNKATPMGSADKLRARAVANLKYLRNEPAQVVPAGWFTFKGA